MLKKITLTLCLGGYSVLFCWMVLLHYPQPAKNLTREMTAIRTHSSLFGDDEAEIPCERTRKIYGVIHSGDRVNYLVDTERNKRALISGADLFLNNNPVIKMDDESVIVNERGMWKKYCFRSDRLPVQTASHEMREAHAIITPYFMLMPQFNDREQTWSYLLTACRQYCVLMQAAGISVHDTLLSFNGEHLTPDAVSTLFSGQKKPRSLWVMRIIHEGKTINVSIPDSMESVFHRQQDEK